MKIGSADRWLRHRRATNGALLTVALVAAQLFVSPVFVAPAGAAPDDGPMRTGPVDPGFLEDGVVDDGVVDDGVVVALDQGPVRVVIALDEAPAGARVDDVAWIDAIQRDIIDELGNAFETHIDFVEVPALVGTIANADSLADLAAIPGVRRVDLDVDGSGFLSDVVPLVGADVLHNLGFTGAGVNVAVLDSGIDNTHVDLSTSATDGACFGDDDGTIDGVGFCPSGSDRGTGASSATEGNGHGSHVSGIITSDGSAAPVGVAPDAGVVPIKVLDNSGFFYFFTEVVAGLEYISLHPELGIDLVNMSLGTNARFPGACDSETAWTIAGAAAVAALNAADITVVAATGNAGQSGEISAPACLSGVVAVGALDKNLSIASYGNRGVELDVMAPGSSVTSVAAGGGTSVKSGTSMATPAVVGCAALLLEAGVVPADIRATLVSSSTSVTDAASGASYPVLECVVPALTCDGQMATHLGTASAETLTGTAGDDVIVALGGADTVVGNGGNDIVCGGDGADIISTGAGDDRVFGGEGGDDIRTFGGDDYIEGGDGDDVIRSGSGPDEVLGGNGADNVMAGNGPDVVDGGAGIDSLNGGAGPDQLAGGAESDAVRGQGGADHLLGDDGDDVIRGHGGNDQLDGGSGADTLLGAEGDDDLLGGENDDIIWAGTGADNLDGGDGGADFCHGGTDADVDTDSNCEIRRKLP